MDLQHEVDVIIEMAVQQKNQLSKRSNRQIIRRLVCELQLRYRLATYPERGNVLIPAKEEYITNGQFWKTNRRTGKKEISYQWQEQIPIPVSQREQNTQNLVLCLP